MSTTRLPRSVTRASLVGIAGLGAAVLLATSAIAAGPGVSEGGAATAPAVRGEQTQIKEPPAPFSATYRVTLSIDWTSATHPGTVPSGAHVSPPVAAAHGTLGAMFERGQPASAGIESMAETGNTGILIAELNANASVADHDKSSGVAGSGNRSMTLELTQNADLISAVTMLAPSPDWFVGFRNQDMFVDDEWVAAAAFNLSNYDAGTDSGTSWRSSNFDTNPAKLISGPLDPTFISAAGQNPFGTVTIQRVD